MDGRRLWLVIALVVGVLVLVPLVVGILLAAVVFFVRTGDPMILLFGALGAFMVVNVPLIVVAVAHVLLRDDLTSEQRVIWTIISVFATPVLAVGALVYLALGKRRTAGLFRDVRFGRERAPPVE